MAAVLTGATILILVVFGELLIHGKFGFPELGVAGAAVATVLSRYVEAIIVVSWTHAHKEQNTYIKGLYRTMKIPVYLVKKGVWLPSVLCVFNIDFGKS